MDADRQRWGAVAFAASIGVACAAIGQMVRPYHLLTHEFAQTFGVVAAVATVFLAARRARGLDGPDRAGQALFEGLGIGAATLIGAWAVQAMANTAVHGCDATDATAFYWITTIPMVAFAAVIGVVTAERGWGTGRQVALLVGLALATGLNDLLQFVVGTRIVDLILGDPAAFNQRAKMDVDPIHAAQRLWVLVGATALWAGAGWRAGRIQGVRAAAVGAAWLALTVGGGSYIGVGLGRARLLHELDGVKETENLVIRYDTAGPVAVAIDGLARDGEWAVQQIVEAWGIRPSRKVEVRVYDTDAILGDLTGISAPHAGPWQVDIPIDRTRTTTFPHELVHALHAEITWNPLVILQRGLTEGTAVAFSVDQTAFPEAHREQAAALASGELPAATRVMRLDGFSSVNESNAYNAAGSFVGFLVLQYGFDRFAVLQRTLDYDRAYGMDLAALDRAWRAFLAEVPVDLEAQAAARERFDPELRPSYLKKRCPKLGTRRDDLADVARRQWRLGDPEGAAVSFTALADKQEKVVWVEHAVRALASVDREPEALALVDRWLERDDVADDGRFRLLQNRASMLARLRDWDALYETLDALDALDPVGTEDRRMLGAGLRDPALREVVVDLVERGIDEDRVAARRLLDERPDDPVLAYLVAARALTLPPAAGGRIGRDERVRIDAVLEALGRAPSACDTRQQDLLSLADRAIRSEDWDVAGRIAGGLRDRCADAVTRHRAEERLRRVDARR